MELLSADATLLRGPRLPTRFGSWLSGDGAFLLLVTVLGTVLRLICLSRPTLWNDEVMTYSRICGTHKQMLDVLRDDTFGPLHYEMYWLMAQVFPATPTLMRLVPALAGAMMIPAMFLLGLELFGRRVARLSCVFAAGSAFLLAYSRDAKMYMELWLAITAHVALLFTALRNDRPWVWASWLLSGIIAVWLHATGFVIGPLDIFIVLVHPRGNIRQTLMILLGLAMIFAGPLWYVARFSRVPGMLHRQGWDAMGITWVNDRSTGHTAGALLADTGSAFAFAYSWIEQPNGRAMLAAWPMVAAAGLLSMACTILCAAMLPWRMLAPRCARESNDADAANRWRATFLLSLWIVIPVYAVYRFSTIRTDSILDWGKFIIELPLQDWFVSGAAAAVVFWLATIPGTRKLLTVITLLLLSWGVAIPIFQALLLDSSSPVRASHGFVLAHQFRRVLVTAMVCILALTWNGCGPTWRERLHLTGRGFIIFGTCLTLCVGIDLLANRSGRSSVWMPRYIGFLYPAAIVGSAALLSRLPSAARWFAVSLFLGVNLSQGIAHIVCSSEPPLDLVAADVIRGARPSSRTLVYTPDTSHTFGPNAVGSIANTCGLYYLSMESGRHLTPEQFREHSVREFFPLRLSADISAIQHDLLRHPDVNNVVIWDREPNETSLRHDGVAVDFLSHWNLLSRQAYPVRSFWNWGAHYLYRRSEYAKEK